MNSRANSSRSGLRALAMSLSLAASPGQAATDTDNLNVTATVVASCVVVGGTLAFGNYDPVAGTDGSASISATCTNQTPYTLRLDAGDGSGATTTLRKLTRVGFTETLNYALYSDAGRTALWGDDGATDVDATGDGLAQNYTVYGRIPAAQTPVAGSYDDVVVITATY